MDTNPDPTAPVEVFRAARPKRARERELVLQAMGIHCLTFTLGAETVVAVPPEEAERALRQLLLYERENRGWPRPEQLPEVLSEGGAGVAIWCALLIALFMIEGQRALGFDWWSNGMINAELVRAQASGGAWSPR